MLALFDNKLLQASDIKHLKLFKHLSFYDLFKNNYSITEVDVLKSIHFFSNGVAFRIDDMRSQFLKNLFFSFLEKLHQ